MKWQGKTWQTSIFIKLILIFLAVIIPLYAMSLMINEWGAESIKHEISSSILSKVHFYLNSLETEISRIKNRQLEYLRDDNLQMLCAAADKMTDYEKVRAINELRRKLLDTRDSSIYIKNVSIHIPLLGKTISAERAPVVMDKDEFEALVGMSKKGSATVIYWNNRIFMNIYLPYLLSPGTDIPLYLCDIELSTFELGKALSQFVDYPGSGFVLINQKQDWFAANKENSDVLMAVKQFLQNRNGKNPVYGIETIKIGLKKYIVSFERSYYLGMTLLAYVPEEEVMGHLRNYRIWFWALSFISILIMLFFSYSIFRLIYQPLLKLVRSFRKVDDGELDISIRHSGNDEFRYLYAHFNIMLEKLKSLIRQVYEEKILVQNAELKQLQSQINPHFLYNSFFLLYRIAKTRDFDKVCQVSQLLGNYFQFITRSAANEITLSMEINHARTYVEIQTMRFSSRIHVEFDDLPADCEKLMVPRLILQPIIENAYEHGLNNKINGGMIQIKIIKLDDRLCISVEDNGEEMDDDKLDTLRGALAFNGRETESTGIINVHRRLQLKFGSGSGLYVLRGELGGLRVEINILFSRGEEVCTIS